MKVDESNFEILNRVSKITLTDYEIKWFDAENIDGYIDEENLIAMIEDLLLEIDHIQEEFDDFKQDVEDNYEPISCEKQIGYNPKEFY